MKRIVAAALLSILVVASSALTGSWLIDSRMEQADRLLRAASDAQGDPATLGIVVRFGLIGRRLQLGEDRVESYELEARMQALLSGSGLSTPIRQSSRPGARVARALFHATRLLVRGEDAPSPAPAALTSLEAAYLWERARRYGKALEGYNRLLADEALPPAVRERVQLHRAFCLAMAGDYAGGRAVCRDLVEAPVLDDTAWVAREMQRFITRIETRQVDIDRDRLQPVDLGRALYLAMDYQGASNVLRSFLEQRTGDPRSAEARYYLARALEERGSDVVEEYRRVMMLDPDGAWGREANRRLVMIGAFYGGSREVSDGATRRLSRMGDTAFVDAVEPYRDLVAPDPALSGLLQASPSAARPAERGELFVQTLPPGAQVSVNGIEMGRSPLFVTDVPFGRSLVRAEAGPWSGELAVNVDQPGIIRVVLSLAAPTGSIAVETSLNGIEVFVDDARAAAVDLIAVAPGKRLLVIRAVDESGRVRYWEREVEVKAGATTVVRVP